MPTWVPCFAAAIALAWACASTPGGLAEVPRGRVALAFERLDPKASPHGANSRLEGGRQARPTTLGALRGRVVLVTIINTWADPALFEVERLKALSAKYPSEDLQIVCIALGEEPEMIRIFAETFQIPYIVARVEDPESFAGERGPLGPIRIIPTSVLIGRDGQIAARVEGISAPAFVEEAVERLVAEDPVDQ